MKAVLRRFVRDEDGATAIEYAMIATLMAAALLAAWPAFYDGFMASWTNAGATISGAVK